MKSFSISLVAVGLFATVAFTPFIYPAQYADRVEAKLSSKTTNLAPLTYKVDPKKSTLAWTAKKVTGEHQGTIAISNGTLLATNNVLVGGSFDIDINSITVTDIQDQESNTKLLHHLKGDDFFAAAKHPKASFVITYVKPKSGNTYDVKGNLTIKGITNEVAFPTTLQANADGVSATAKITVDRTKYDIKYRSTNFFENLGDKAIYDTFDLDVVLVAAK